MVDITERFKEAGEMHKKQTDEKKSKYEADTHKAAEMRRRSLETFFESNARLRNDPVVKNPEILEVKRYNIYVKKVRMD